MRTLVGILMIQLLSTMGIVVPARAAEGAMREEEQAKALEQLMADLGALTADCSSAEVLKRFPGAVEVPKSELEWLFRDGEQDAKQREEKLAHVKGFERDSNIELLPNQFFLFTDDKLTSFLCASPGGLFDTGWEGADVVVHWARAAIEAMEKVWGPPDFAGTSAGEIFRDSALLEWKLKTMQVSVMFTLPASILGEGGAARFTLNMASPNSTQEAPELGASWHKMFNVPFDRKELVADYAAFRQRLDVVPAPESASFFPKELGPLQIGMPVKEVRDIRPTMYGQEFRVREEFGDSFPEGSDFDGLSHKARKDCLVVTRFSKRTDALQWCDEHWGTPTRKCACRLPRGEKTIETAVIFVWDRKNCGAAVQVCKYPKPYTNMAVFSSSVSLEVAFATARPVEDLNLGIDEVRSEWRKLVK